MSSPALRTQPIDRRRLTMQERSSYRPNNRLGAIARAKSFKSSLKYNANRKPFATEQKPGSGGMGLGSAQLYQRLAQKGAEKRRAESFRPENAISRDIYKELAT